MANDFQITHELADLPPELWAYLKEHRFFAMIIKKSTADWSSPLMRSPVYCKNCPASPGFWLSPSAFQTHSAPASCCSTMVRKSRRITICRDWRAAEIPCFALTSPEAGSDAGAIPDTGVVCMGEWQGQQVLGMRLTRTSVTLRWHR